MANLIYKDIRVKIDNSTGTLTDITSYISNASIRAVQDIIEDTSMADSERSYLFGLAGATIPLSGMVNSTTEGIFGPLIGNRTTAAKTIEYRAYLTSTDSTGQIGMFYNGEVLVGSVEMSGSTNSLQTFGTEATFDGLVNRTSREL